MRTNEQVTIYKAQCDSCHQKVEVRTDEAFGKAIKDWALIRIYHGNHDGVDFDFCDRCIKANNGAVDAGDIKHKAPDVWSLIRTATLDRNMESTEYAVRA